MTQAGELIFLPGVSLLTDYEIRERLARISARDKRVELAFYGNSTLTVATFLIRGWVGHLAHLTSIIIQRDFDWVLDNLKTSDCLFLVACVLFDGIDPKKIKEEQNKQEDPNRIKAKRKGMEMSDWIHYFAERYGWSEEQIMNLTRKKFNGLIEAALRAKEAEEEASKKRISPVTGREMNPVRDRRTKDDPHGVDSVMAFAKQFGVEG